MGSPFISSVRTRIRAKHYSIHTEKAYVRWIVRFIRHCDMAHPGTVGAEEINSFLTHLALKNVAPNTQAQALNALVFLKTTTSRIRETRTFPGCTCLIYWPKNILQLPGNWAGSICFLAPD